MRRLVLIFVLLSVSGCAFFRGTPALRPLTFTIVGVSDVNLAGVTMVGKTSYTDLTRTDITQLTAGLIGEKVPTTIAIHLKVENPNSVVARMVNLDLARTAIERAMDQLVEQAGGVTHRNAINEKLRGQKKGPRCPRPFSEANRT
jgi:hypothetical protein